MSTMETIEGAKATGNNVSLTHILRSTKLRFATEIYTFDGLCRFVYTHHHSPLVSNVSFSSTFVCEFCYNTVCHVSNNQLTQSHQP